MAESDESRNDRSESLLGLAKDGAKIVGSAIVVAAGYVGTPLSGLIHAHWSTVALAAALAVSIYIHVSRERHGTAQGRSLGLVRVEAKREKFTESTILHVLARKKNIDMIGFNLRSPWLKSDSDFDQMIRSRLRSENDLRLRVIIADPDRESLRTRDENESRVAAPGRLQADGNAVKNYLGSLRTIGVTESVQVKVVDADLIRCSLIVADDRMFATWYLSFRRGGQSPTLEIKGEQTPFYTTFKQEFEELWERGWSLG